MAPNLGTSAQIPKGSYRGGSHGRGPPPFFLFLFDFAFLAFLLSFFLVCWDIIVDTEGGMTGWHGMAWGRVGRGGATGME